MRNKESSARISLVGTGLVCLLTSATHLLGTHSAYADEQSASLEEVIVTAQRRQERIIDVPVSVTAVSGNTIAELNINQVTQLQDLVPSLEIEDAGPIPKISLRGIALNDYGESNESPVAIYSNDVYIGSPASPLSQLFDINRIEVLRGPQGTLFGRNATGGLIQIITNKPTNDYSGSASIQYGSFNQTIVQADQNIPFGDAIRTRTAAIFNRDDGWQLNLVTSSRVATTNLFGLRETVDVDINDALTNSAIVHYGLENDLSSEQAFRGTLNPVTGVPCSVSMIEGNECVTSDGYRNPNPNPHDVYSSLARPRNHLQTFGFDNSLKYSAAAFNITSISAYEKTVTTHEEDDGSTADPLFIAIYHAAREQVSQEIRADGSFGDFKWVGGVYYFHERLPDGYITLPVLAEVLGGTLGVQNEYKQTTESEAGFGQVDYKVLPTITLTGGIRYTHERQTLTISDSFTDPSYINSYNPSNSKITWRGGVEWQIDDSLMAYATASTGFKSAAFDTSLVVATESVPSKPETNKNYEIGIKGETDDHKWEGSVSAFHTIYSNFQTISVPLDASGNYALSILLNVPRANINGAEQELTAHPFGGLSVTGNLTELGTKIKDPGSNIDGKRLTLAPSFSAKALVRYDVEANAVGTVSPWFDVSYRTQQLASLPGSELEEIPGYTLLNTGITWRLPYKKWEVEFLIQNALNKDYLTNSPNYDGLDFLKFGEVRTFAVKVSTKW